SNFPVLLRDVTRIFPCHICFDRNLMIQHVGTFLLNEYNLANKKGLYLHNVLELLEPNVLQMDFASFLEHANTRFIVRLKVDGNRAKCGQDLNFRLSGQMQPLASGNSIVFLCSPYVKTVRQLLDARHYISDMPIRDATRLVVMLNQSRMWQLEQNKHLDELRVAHAGLKEELTKQQTRNRQIQYRHVPAQIVEMLQHGKTFDPHMHRETTVLSCSVADFATITAVCNPPEVMAMLNELNSRFNRLIEMRKLHLLQAQADSWLVVGWAADRSHVSCASSALDLALGMTAEARQIIVRHFGLPIRCITQVLHFLEKRMHIIFLHLRFVIYGESVQAAHALCAKADPGKCLVSNAVR
ncbi:hypothetical protein PMAYCL1PPCAC_09284, partial [Pristionchus mayeri]